MHRDSAPLARKVSEEIHNIWRSSERIYVFCDPFESDPLSEISGDLPFTPRKLPLNDPIFADIPELKPYLIAMEYGNLDHSALMDFFIASAFREASSDAPRRICAWLVAEGAEPPLLRTMQRNLEAKYAEGKSVYLRYFDPRVTPRLMSLLASDQAATLFGPVVSWSHLDREGSLITHSRPSPSLPMRQLRLTQDVAQAVERIEAVNLVAAKLKLLGRAVPHSGDAEIDAHLVSANQKGLLDQDDQVEYATRAMHFGATFLSAGGLAAAIERCLRSGTPLGDLLDQTPDSELNLS